MERRDMTEIFEQELRKLRNFPRYRFHSFVFNSEIDAARRRLKLSGVSFRTRPKIHEGVHIGYNIYVEEL